jgi:flagellar motor switch protein FliG
MSSTVSIRDLDGTQKAAVLLMALGTDRAALVLRQLREAEVTEIMSEVARLPDVSAEVIGEVLEEFEVTSQARRHMAVGGIEVAQELLQASLGTEKADEIFEQLSRTFAAAPFEFLRRIEPRLLLSFIRDEHPQCIALVLAHMNPDGAALVLSGLPEEEQRDVALRIATMDKTSPEIITTVETALHKRLSSVTEQGDMSSAGGVQVLVELLNRSERGVERLIFERLERHDPELADEVRSRMFVFEDITTIDDRAVQQILRQVDSKDLALALKGVRNDVKHKVMSNLSSRAAENLEADIEVLGPVRLAAVEEAQGKVVRVIRALEEDGQIVLVRASDEFIE